MEHNPLLVAEVDILVLLLVACITAISLTKLKFPYTVGLVVIGMGLGWLGNNVESLEFLQTLTLSHDLILFVFVPPLIFESAINLDSRFLFRNIIPILTLAAPGLLISTAIVGFILNWGTALTLSEALLFGSLISATDPVAVIALFKELGAPKQLSVLVEGESLFNDATAIVTFSIILGLISEGSGLTTETLQQGTMDFLVNFGGGIAVGAIIGWIAQYPMSLAKENSLILATISTILAYSSFLIADEWVGVSGVISLVTAGIMAGWFNSNRLQPETRHFMGEFWEYAAFLANSLIFLLVGITAVDFEFFNQFSETQSFAMAMVLTIGTVLLARAVVVFALIPLVNVFRKNDPVIWKYQIVSYWGGLRGAVCLALALSLSPEFPNRELIVSLTLGIAVFTLLIPGTTISFLMRWLELDRPSILDQFDKLVAQLFSTRKALERSIAMENSVVISEPEVITIYREKYELENQHIRNELKEFLISNALDEEMVQELVWLEALAIERRIYRRIYDEGLLSETLLSQFNLLVNLRQDDVLEGTIPPQFKGRRTLEVRLRQLALSVGAKVAPDSKWVARLQESSLIAASTFWVVANYVGIVLPKRLREFFEMSGVDLSILQPCLDLYEKQRARSVEQLQELEQSSPGLMKKFQTEASNRFGMLAQKEAIETLVDEGNITEAVGKQVLQTLD